MCVIISEAVEDDYGGNNSVINSQGDNPGNIHRKEREKVYVSAGEWKMIKSAVNHGMTSTCGFPKRSSNGIPVHPAPAQEAATAREKQAKEKP
jgi:hypothetical protein